MLNFQTQIVSIEKSQRAVTASISSEFQHIHTHYSLFPAKCSDFMKYDSSRHWANLPVNRKKQEAREAELLLLKATYCF